MKRISILGSPGAGKSTLALAMGEALNLEVVHLDKVFWDTTWKALPQPAREAALAEILERESFIVEGGVNWVLAACLARCDTVIWLDIPLHRRFFSLLRRNLSNRTPLGQHHRDARQRQLAWLRLMPMRLAMTQIDDTRAFEPAFADPFVGPRMIRLQSRAEARTFLQTLDK